MTIEKGLTMTFKCIYWEYYSGLNLFKFKLSKNVYYSVSEKIWFCQMNIKKVLLPDTCTFSEEELFQNTIYSDIKIVDFSELNFIQKYLSTETIKDNIEYYNKNGSCSGVLSYNKRGITI